jgi:hypothetical protein
MLMQIRVLTFVKTLICMALAAIVLSPKLYWISLQDPPCESDLRAFAHVETKPEQNSHLCKVYKAATPEPANTVSDCVRTFGLV